MGSAALGRCMQFLRKITDAYSEVPELQQRAAEKWDSLMSAIVGYRLLLTEIRNRARHLDEEVREQHIELQADYGSLRVTSSRFWNKFPWSIRRLQRKWLELIARMDTFEALINRAMKGAKFYNKMLESKETLSKRRKLTRDYRKEFTRSVYSLVRTIHYALVRERMLNGITQGSEMLTMDTLVLGWIYELKKIRADRAYCDECATKVALTCPNDPSHHIGNQQQKGVDVGIATLALVHRDRYDTLILSSGDGDLLDAVEFLSEQGKKIELAVFTEGVSTDLQARADDIRWINDFADEIRREPRHS